MLTIAVTFKYCSLCADGPKLLTSEAAQLSFTSRYLTLLDMDYSLPQSMEQWGTHGPQKLSKTHKNSIYSQAMWSTQQIY